jgi:DNA-directed RNA polymerase specialized sigma24 family protein
MAELTEDDFLAALEEQQAIAEGVGPEEVTEQLVPQQAQAPVQEQQEAPSFTQWEQYRNDPRFADLSPAQKQNLFDDWQNYATQYLAQNGELATEEDVKYTEGVFTDIAKIDNLRKPIFNAPNYVEQLAQQAQSGFGAMEAGTAGYASALGMTDTATASDVISQKYREQRDRYVNPELKKFTEDQLGFFGTAGRILTNPFDIALPLFTQSMASSAPAIALGAGAGAAGTLVGGPAVGLGAGLATGAAASGVVDGVITFNQMVIEEVGKRGLDPANAKDVQAVLDDPKFVSDAVAYSAARGVVISAAELATFGAGKYVGTALRGANVAGKAATISAPRKLGIATTIAGVETVGEGVGETGAQIAAPLATGRPIELQPGEIAAEMFVQTPANIVQGGLQTARTLLDANAPSSASEVTREAVQAAAEGKYEQVLGVQPSVATPTDAQKYYDGLSIAEKARVLGMAPNAVLTREQGTYSSLSEEEKAKVQVDFGPQAGAQQGLTVEEAEARAREAFQPTEPAPVVAQEPVPVAETPAPAEEVPVTAVVQAPSPTPLEIVEAKPIAEQESAPLQQVAPATAQVVAQEEIQAPAPVAETPASVELGRMDENTAQVIKAKTKDKTVQIDNKPFSFKFRERIDEPNGVFYSPEITIPDTDTTIPTLKTAALKAGVKDFRAQKLKSGDLRVSFTPPATQAESNPEKKSYTYAPRITVEGNKVFVGDAFAATNLNNILEQTAPVTPAPTPAPVTPAVQKLPPTKKQVTALTKLGYLPADIEGLDRTQAKDIVTKQTPKTPTVEAPKETAPEVAAGAPAPEAPAVPPAPVSEPTAPKTEERPAGEVSAPVAPTAGEPTTPQTEQQRLTEAEQKLQAKVGEVIAEADQLGVDEESVRAWLGPTPSEEKVLRTRAVLRLLNLGLADVYNNIRKVAAKTRGRQGEITQEGGPKIKRVVFTTREEGAGLLSNPEDMNALDVIYVNPDRLLSRLRADVTTDAADFFVKVLEEELLHVQHGRAAFDLFAGTVPEDQVTPENFKNFFRRQSEEIENSLTLGQIQEVVGKYAGIDTAGKTKEQLIQEFAEASGRRGRLAEEYLRTLIQRRMLGDITEDKVRGLTPNPVLRSLGMIKNWLGKFVGETIPKKYANQTPVERYYNAVSDLIYGNTFAKIREARDEKGTAIPGKETLSASTDPMAVRRRFEQTTYQKELVKKINEDFGLGKPRDARKGAIWAKTVGRLIGKFPTFKPNEVEAIVGEDIPDAVKFFDPSQGAVFTTYLYQRAYNSMLDARDKQRRTGIYEAGRVDVPGSVERARFQPLSEQIKKVEKPKDVTAEATAEEIASELESQESAAEEAANNIVARDADEVVQKYAEVAGKQAEEDQSFEEMMGPKTISGELTAPGFSPSQAAARNDLSKVFDELFASFPQEVLPSGETASREQDVFDFLFRANEMENPPTRKGIMEKYNLGHSRQYDRIVESVREKVANTLAENNIFSAGQLTASIDPMATQALRRSLKTVPEAVANLLRARTYFPYENKELLQKANDFVDANAGENDIFQAKIALDRASETQVSNPERIITLGVIGKRLKDALFALDKELKKEGDTFEPETLAFLFNLRDKYSNDLYDILSAAQDILSSSGQDLQAGRVFANLFSPEQMEKAYTKPIEDAQKKLLGANSEIIKLKALIKELKNELATKAVDKGLGVIATPEPEKKFYDLLSLFGVMEPGEQESFDQYLTRLGVDYAALMAALERTITASVDPVSNANPLPQNFRNLNAREAIKQLVALDKNFFSKLVNLRLKTGATSTEAEVATAQAKKSNTPADKEKRKADAKTASDFLGTPESEKPASEEAIDKDPLPVVVRLTKYASDAVTGRVMRSLGLDKKTTPKGLFDEMEKQVRKFVNLQFKQELDPQRTAAEDTRTTEQKLLDLVERIGMAEQIFNQTKANLQARLDGGKIPEADRAALQAAVNRTFDANKIVESAKEIKQLADFKAEARKHLSQRGASVASLYRLIKERLPQFNDAQAKALSDLITANYNRLVQESASKQLNNILKRSVTKESKTPKKEVDQLIELMNLGAFDEAKFYNAIADRFGLPSWDPEVIKEIRSRAEAIDRLPQGSDQRTVAALQLQGFMAQKLKDQAKGYAKAGYILDVMGSLWKAGVLSGFGTQSVNLLSTAGNVGLELLTSAIGYSASLAADNKIGVNPGKFIYDIISTYIDNLGRVAPQEAMDAFATGFGRLRSENQKQITPLEAFSIDSKLPKGAKATAKWSLNNYLSLAKLVGRAMAAADTFNANIANEAKMRMQMRYLLLADKGMTSQQADEMMKNLFSANSDMMNGIREQVDREAEAGQFGTLDGLDPKSLAYRVQNRKIEAGKRRRIAQLREQAIATEVAGDNADETIKGVKNFTEVATFNNNPTGALGLIGDTIARIGNKFKLAQPFTSFTRTVANVVNASLNYTPYGYARMAGFSLGNLAGNIGNKYEFKGPKEVEFYKLQTQATMGTLAILALGSLFFKDMKEPWDKADFAVTGLGPSDKNKRDQLRASGWAENSVKVTTPLGSFQFRHSDIPGLSLVLGGLGMLSDSIRYGSLSDADATTLAAYTAASLGSVVFEKNLLSGAKSLFDILKLKEDPVAALQKGAGQYVGGITNPGLFRWLAQTVGVNERGMVEQIDYRKLNSTVPGFLLGLTPVAIKAGAPRLNRLGEAVEEYPWTASTKRIGFFPEVKPHPVLSPLVGADLFVPGVSRLTKINVYRKGRPEQVRVDVTEDTYYDYAKYNGQYLKRVLTPARARSLANRARVDREGAQDELQDLAQQAKKYAVDRIEAQIRTKGLGQ